MLSREGALHNFHSLADLQKIEDLRFLIFSPLKSILLMLADSRMVNGALATYRWRATGGGRGV